MTLQELFDMVGRKETLAIVRVIILNLATNLGPHDQIHEEEAEDLFLACYEGMKLTAEQLSNHEFGFEPTDDLGREEIYRRANEGLMLIREILAKHFPESDFPELEVIAPKMH
ncbi:MAG: hypothetical protein Q8P69_01120 [bacterium]|nr:hypothetical protein [bacterium]